MTAAAQPVRRAAADHADGVVSLRVDILRHTARAVLVRAHDVQPHHPSAAGLVFWLPRRVVCLFGNREGHTEAIFSRRILNEKLAALAQTGQANPEQPRPPEPVRRTFWPDE